MGSWLAERIGSVRVPRSSTHVFSCAGCGTELSYGAHRDTQYWLVEQRQTRPFSPVDLPVEAVFPKGPTEKGAPPTVDDDGQTVLCQVCAEKWHARWQQELGMQEEHEWAAILACLRAGWTRFPAWALAVCWPDGRLDHIVLHGDHAKRLSLQQYWTSGCREYRATTLCGSAMWERQKERYCTQWEAEGALIDTVGWSVRMDLEGRKREVANAMRARKEGRLWA